MGPQKHRLGGRLKGRLGGRLGSIGCAFVEHLSFVKLLGILKILLQRNSSLF